MSTLISGIAQNVWEDLGEPTSPSVYSISGWMTNNLGKLNVKIEREYLVSGNYFTPEFGNTEKSIYSEMYNAYYYKLRLRNAINGIIVVDTGNSSISDWVELREGDSVVKRSASTQSESIKMYKGLYTESQNEVDKLCNLYKRNLSEPRQVVGDEAPIL